jgi:hypothetical protein
MVAVTDYNMAALSRVAAGAVGAGGKVTGPQRKRVSRAARSPSSDNIAGNQPTGGSLAVLPCEPDAVAELQRSGIEHGASYATDH